MVSTHFSHFLFSTKFGRPFRLATTNDSELLLLRLRIKIQFTLFDNNTTSYYLIIFLLSFQDLADFANRRSGITRLGASVVHVSDCGYQTLNIHKEPPCPELNSLLLGLRIDCSG